MQALPCWGANAHRWPQCRSSQQEAGCSCLVQGLDAIAYLLTPGPRYIQPLTKSHCWLPTAREAAEADEEEQVRKKLRISPEDAREFQRLDYEAKAKTARMQIDCNGLASAQQAGLAFAQQQSVQ